MFGELLKDALNEYTYAADLAGLGYDLNSTIYGLIVRKCIFTQTLFLTYLNLTCIYISAVNVTQNAAIIG